MNDSTVTRARLISELTQLDDRKRSRGVKSWNPHFLGIAFGAVQDVYDAEIAAGQTPAAAFAETFTPTRDTHTIARRLGLPLDVDRGRWVVLDNSRGCSQCGAPMNPVERMLGPVCGKCCRANHAAVVGR